VRQWPSTHGLGMTGRTRDLLEGILARVEGLHNAAEEPND
jgi:hypothetical protein